MLFQNMIILQSIKMHSLQKFSTLFIHYVDPDAPLASDTQVGDLIVAQRCQTHSNYSTGIAYLGYEYWSTPSCDGWFLETNYRGVYIHILSRRRPSGTSSNDSTG